MINIAEILKDCPKGTKLYSPLCGECYFDRVSYDTIICKKQNSQEITFTSKGYYMLPVFDDSEPVLFPSKENRDWSTFQRPFKDGDIVYIQSLYEYIVIYKKTNCKKIYKHAAFCISFNNHLLLNNNILCCEEEVKKIRLATEEEKQKLFQAIKEKGYKWNAETKSLEKIIVPKFKVGDKIVEKDNPFKYWYVQGIDTYCNSDFYYIVTKGQVSNLHFKDQDNWELVPDKFDISTLKPFESRVLVRDYYHQCWKVSFFGYFDKFMGKFDTVRGVYIQCIPYEGNEHLLGTTNNCDEYFKTW